MQEEEELSIKDRIALIELENNDRKADAQRRIVWVCLFAIFIVLGWVMMPASGVLFFPGIAETRLELLIPVIGWFFGAMGGIIATFFGAQAWSSKPSVQHRVYTAAPSSKSRRTRPSRQETEVETEYEN